MIFHTLAISTNSALFTVLHGNSHGSVNFLVSVERDSPLVTRGSSKRGVLDDTRRRRRAFLIISILRGSHKAGAGGEDGISSIGVEAEGQFAGEEVQVIGISIVHGGESEEHGVSTNLKRDGSIERNRGELIKATRAKVILLTFLIGKSSREIVSGGINNSSTVNIFKSKSSGNVVITRTEDNVGLVEGFTASDGLVRSTSRFPDFSEVQVFF